MDKAASHVMQMVSAQFHHTLDISFSFVEAVEVEEEAVEVEEVVAVEEEAAEVEAAQALEP